MDFFDFLLNKDLFREISNVSQDLSNSCILFIFLDPDLKEIWCDLVTQAKSSIILSSEVIKSDFDLI